MDVETILKWPHKKLMEYQAFYLLESKEFQERIESKIELEENEDAQGDALMKFFGG